MNIAQLSTAWHSLAQRSTAYSVAQRSTAMQHKSSASVSVAIAAAWLQSLLRKLRGADGQVLSESLSSYQLQKYTGYI